MKKLLTGFLLGLTTLVVMGTVYSQVSRILDLVPGSPGEGEIIKWSSGAATWAADASGVSWTNQTANTVLAGPSSGGAAHPTFRAMVADDIPDISSVYQTADASLDTFAGIDPTASAQTLLSANTISANIGISVSSAPATNVVNLLTASATNILNGDLTILHATNGATATEYTHVRWFWAGGANRALTIPTDWKTNAFSAVPANITNGLITKMYVTSIGDTGSSANQSNVFVSFEYYK